MLLTYIIICEEVLENNTIIRQYKGNNMVTEMNDIAALVVNYNSWAQTEECVDHLLDISDKLNVLIVDNCSTDTSVEELKQRYLKNTRVHILANPHNDGYAKGNNAGIQYVQEKLSGIRYILILNPDIIVRNKKTILALKQALEENEGYAAASCQIVLNNQWTNNAAYMWRFPKKKHLWWAGTFVQRLLLKNTNNTYDSVQVSNGIAEVDVVTGCFFMAKMDDLLNVGGFDDRTFLYYEETILAKKFARINKQEAILIGEYVCHEHQKKDAELKDYRNRLFHRQCFHNSKKIYIEYYSDMHGIEMFLCKTLNAIDYGMKTLLYGLLGMCSKS